MTTHYNAIFLSDIHLGNPDCKAELLLEFLALHTCNSLYLVGDIVDLWQMQKQFTWPEKHNEVLHKIIALSHTNCQVKYLPGNHDAPLQKYNDLHIGDIEVKRKMVHTTILKQQFLVLHGDQFDEYVTLGKFQNWLGNTGYDLVLLLNRQYNLFRSWKKAPYRSLAGYIKSRIKGAQAAIHRYKVACIDEAKFLNLDGVICGHIHHPEQDEIDGILYFNDGDWIENCSALCETQSGDMILLDWVAERERQKSELRSIKNDSSTNLNAA
ncbi:MAG: UDP-2,3-diacylglucosamine diphosphatase [Glaciecola sp.]|nr:UDP-2,3-diacylglucosamine diphosphatase [Glaciecola sp.]MDG2100360.1 UDP-2,3-diacylglucosamine diphosphatase [Glaciecola sp.]